MVRFACVVFNLIATFMVFKRKARESAWVLSIRNGLLLHYFNILEVSRKLVHEVFLHINYIEATLLSKA